MTSLPLAQKESFEELRHFDAEERRINDEDALIDEEIAKLLARKKELLIKKKDLAEKRSVSRERLQKMIIEGELPLVPLRFDKNKRTIYWEADKSVKLGKIPFQIIKVLYDAPKHRLSWGDIEEKVWGESKDGAIFTAVTRLCKVLSQHNFPYRLTALTRKTWIPDAEYEEDANRPSPTMKTLTGYGLE